MSALGIILFDMDGTLVDSMELHTVAFSQALAEAFQIDLALGRQGYWATAGQPLDAQFRYVLSAAPAPSQAQIDALVDRFWELMAVAQPALFPDVPAAIQRFAAAGYILGITSGSSTPTIQARMRLHGLEQHFRFLLGADREHPERVKGPGHFAVVMEGLGLDPVAFAQQTLMIGDTSHDMQIGKAAGLLSIGRETGQNAEQLYAAGADLLIQDFNQLLALLLPNSAGEPLPVRQIQHLNRSLN